jgi:hypothetical protein
MVLQVLKELVLLKMTSILALKANLIKEGKKMQTIKCPSLPGPRV